MDVQIKHSTGGKLTGFLGVDQQLLARRPISGRVVAPNLDEVVRVWPHVFQPGVVPPDGHRLGFSFTVLMAPPVLHLEPPGAQLSVWMNTAIVPQILSATHLVTINVTLGKGHPPNDGVCGRQGLAVDPGRSVWRSWGQKVHQWKDFALGSFFPTGLVFSQILSRICCDACSEFKWVFFHQRAKGVVVSFIPQNIKPPRLQLARVAPSVFMMLHFYLGVDQSLRHTVSFSPYSVTGRFLESSPKYIYTVWAFFQPGNCPAVLNFPCGPVKQETVAHCRCVADRNGNTQPDPGVYKPFTMK